MIRLIVLFAFAIGSLLFQAGAFAEDPKHPKVWIYTDMSDPTLPGTNHRGTINDPDDVSAMAGYLLMADRFDTLGIVVASTHRKEHAKTPDQAVWANRVFGEAYRADVAGLKQSSRRYPDEIQFVQSCIKESAEKFVDSNRYDSLAQYSTVKSLFDTASQLGDDEIINVLCWGSLTEPAILVAHCLATNNESLLKKLRFIAHWTNSPLHQGTPEHPERVANCQEDAAACRYMKSMAGAGKIVYYECGAIGQHGIVSGSPKGKEYFDQFRTSRLGTLFVDGKYVNNCVDHSDSATYWVLLGEYGVSLKNIAANGTNSADLERANEAKFAAASREIHDELLRRAKHAANKISHTPVPAVNHVKGHGETIGHTEAIAAWETLETQGEPTARHEASMVAFEGMAYLLGGRRIKPVDVFNPSTNKWTAKSPSPMELHHFQAVAMKDRIYLMGVMSGPYPNEKPLEKIVVYYPHEDRFDFVHSIPESRRRGGAGAVHYNNRIYLIGGITHGHRDGCQPWFDQYDPQTGQWDIMSDAPHARDHFQAAVIGDRLYAAGGRQTSKVTNEVFSKTVAVVDVFDFKTGKWLLESDCPVLPTPRAGNSTSNVDGKLFVAGGETQKQNLAHSEVEVYDPTSNSWTSFPSLQRGRHGSGLAKIGDYLYTASGSGARGGSPELASTERLRLKAIEMTDQVHNNNPLTLNGQSFYGADPSVVVADDDRLFLFPTTDNRDWEMQFGWSCYSTTDLANWNDHGVIFSNEDSSWGTHKAWAPDIIRRGGKYYLYYYFNNGGGGKGGVGVALADKPEGPCKEITKERLCAGHDPAVFGDDDGRFWLYLQDKVYELGDDMASFKSGPTNLNLEYRPEKFEAAYVFKRNGLYYFTIARDWNNLIFYTGSSPTGPFEFRGEFFKKYGGNNHHSIVKYKDKWVIFYHEWVKNDPVHQRRLRAEYLNFNEDDTIQLVEPTDQGVRFDQIAELAVDDVSQTNDVPGLRFSGKVDWDAGSGTVTFASSGSMPDSLEDFFWGVPASVKKIVIESDVTVQGAFRVTFRDAKNPLFITGRDRKTSVIAGTPQQKWTENAGIAESDKWRYGAINVVEDAIVHVSNLTSRNPRGYNISGYANKAVIHVDGCDLLDTRGGDNNNSDGFLGAAGSSICNSFISTSDDAIKVYHDITIENVTIEQHRNGAPLQFGWGDENDTATATIKNLVIRGVSADGKYNLAPLTWSGGRRGVRNVSIDGLTIDLQGKIYNKTKDTWQPIGLMLVKPSQCTLNLAVKRAKMGDLPHGLNAAQGSVRIE